MFNSGEDNRILMRGHQISLFPFGIIGDDPYLTADVFVTLFTFDANFGLAAFECVCRVW